MNDTQWLVESTALVKRYGRVEALRGVDLRLGAGQIVGLVGPNGSGKSTFLKVVAGLLHPDGGSVKVRGRSPGLETKRWVAFQPEIDHLYRWMTVQQAMELQASVVGDWDARRAAELLEFLNLHQQRRTPVRNLSRGMRARLKLAMTLSRNAPIVLLDEPLSGIDPPSRGRIIRALIGQFRTDEQVVVLATHEVAETESTFDRVVFLEKGTVKIDEDAQKLRERYGKSIQAIMEEVYA
ncbi:MAG: ABC transporter ATP-binding protein [Limnochordaceae bacterium]|nr:ABC transporter ATP-binding protein [Limnochordaceae bacterium]